MSLEAFTLQCLIAACLKGLASRRRPESADEQGVYLPEAMPSGLSHAIAQQPLTHFLWAASQGWYQ